MSLVTPRRTFAIVQATTRKRIDIGVRLGGTEPHGRLPRAKSPGNDTIRVRIAPESVDDLDAGAIAWLQRAYQDIL